MRLESGLSARTIARRVSSVSGLYAYLIARGDTAVQANPVPHGLSTRRQGGTRKTRTTPLVRVPRTLPKILQPGEVDRLIAALRTDRDRAMVLAMLLAGLRRCEGRRRGGHARRAGIGRSRRGRPVNAVPAEPVAVRGSAGTPAEVQWAQIEAAAPQVAATMKRYLQRLGAVLAPKSVEAAENALRQFTRWMLTDTQIDAITNTPRRHRGLQGVAGRPTWTARSALGRDASAAAAHRARVLRADHRVGLARRPAPQPGHRRGHSEEA